eukprot:gene3576-2527_t
MRNINFIYFYMCFPNILQIFKQYILGSFISYLFVRILFYYVIIMFFLQLTTTHSQVLLKFFASYYFFIFIFYSYCSLDPFRIEIRTYNFDYSLHHFYLSSSRFIFFIIIFELLFTLILNFLFLSFNFLILFISPMTDEHPDVALTRDQVIQQLMGLSKGLHVDVVFRRFGKKRWTKWSGEVLEPIRDPNGQLRAVRITFKTTPSMPPTLRHHDFVTFELPQTGVEYAAFMPTPMDNISIASGEDLESVRGDLNDAGEHTATTSVEEEEHFQFLDVSTWGIFLDSDDPRDIKYELKEKLKEQYGVRDSSKTCLKNALNNILLWALNSQRYESGTWRNKINIDLGNGLVLALRELIVESKNFNSELIHNTLRQQDDPFLKEFAKQSDRASKSQKARPFCTICKNKKLGPHAEASRQMKVWRPPNTLPARSVRGFADVSAPARAEAGSALERSPAAAIQERQLVHLVEEETPVIASISEQQQYPLHVKAVPTLNIEYIYTLLSPLKAKRLNYLFSLLSIPTYTDAAQRTSPPLIQSDIHQLHQCGIIERDLFLRHAREANVSYNTDETHFGTVYDFIGVAFNHRDHTVQLREKTIMKLQPLTQDITFAQMERLHSQLLFASSVLNVSQSLFYWAIKLIRRRLSQLSRRPSLLSAPAALPRTSFEQLSSWRSTIALNLARRITRPRSDRSAWQGDALFWHINVLEARAVVNVLEAASWIQDGSFIHLYIDNTSVIGTFKKDRGVSFLLNQAVLDLNRWMAQHQCPILQMLLLDNSLRLAKMLRRRYSAYNPFNYLFDMLTIFSICFFYYILRLKSY